MITTDSVYAWLEEVKDPEIPVLSLVDLGIIRNVNIDGSIVHVTLTPTFVGCPALELMKSEIREKLQSRGIENVIIDISFAKPWSSDDITEKGRHALKKFGLSPPPRMDLIGDLTILEHAECPRCGGTNTDLRTPFGPTLCRAIYYCHDCRDAFEQFKPL